MYRTEHSRRMGQSLTDYLAGGVNSSNRLTADPNLFFDRGEGGHIFDVDGNKYIDYRLGAGPLILGHSPKAVIAAVKGQLDRGLQTGVETPLCTEVAARLVELIPCAELVRFTNSGSEAVHLALMLAKAYRGRNKIIRFEGHYHGWFDNIATKVPLNGSTDIAASAGQGRALDDVIVLPWNDLAVFAQAVKNHSDEIAGVIMTPMMVGTGGGAVPRKDYLEGVREICTKDEIVLILDEIITGFRIAQGGAQELYGVLPDLATYAKAIGAGFPIAAVAGCKEVMNLISTGSVRHLGTYNGNLLCMAATKAALAELTANDGHFYRYCNDVRQHLADGIRESAARYDIPLRVSGAGAVLNIWFTDNPDYCDYRSSRLGHDPQRQSKFAQGLLLRGIVLTLSFMYISSVHTKHDVQSTLAAMEEIMKDL